MICNARMPKRKRLNKESALGLRYNIAAFVIAIVRKDVYIPEQAFAIIAGRKFKVDEKDVEDMMIYRNEGMTYKEIGEIYGLSKDNVYGKIRKIREKNLKA